MYQINKYEVEREIFLKKVRKIIISMSAFVRRKYHPFS